MSSRRREKQKRKKERRLPIDLRTVEDEQAHMPRLGQPRIMCTACKEAGREACTLFHIIECDGDCEPPCGGDHMKLICSACGESSAIVAEDLIAGMHWPEVCCNCGKVFDMSTDGGGVGDLPGVATSIGAPPGVEEIYYCPICFAGVE